MDGVYTYADQLAVYNVLGDLKDVLVARDYEPT